MFTVLWLGFCLPEACYQCSVFMDICGLETLSVEI